MTKIYMAIRYPKNWTGKKDIKIITLEEHLKKYNFENLRKNFFG